MVLARRVLALLAFLLSSPSVVAQSEHAWRAAPYSWEKGPSEHAWRVASFSWEKGPLLDYILVGVNVVIALLVLLSLCVCCCCCSRMRTRATGTIAAGSVVVPRVLDQHSIEMFPPLSFQSDQTVGFGESKSVICFEEFVERGNVRALPCRHIFHPDCIDTWLTSRSTECPVYRHDYSG